MYDRFLDIHVTGPNGEYSHPFDIQAMGDYVLSKMRADDSINSKSPSAVFFIQQDTTNPDLVTISNINISRLPSVGYVAVAVPLADFDRRTFSLTYKLLIEWVGDKWHRGKIRVSCHGASNRIGEMVVAGSSTHVGNIGRWLVANKLPSVSGRAMWRALGGACGLATVTLAICYAAREDTNTGPNAIMSGVEAVRTMLSNADYQGIVVTGARVPVRIRTANSQLLGMARQQVSQNWSRLSQTFQSLSDGEVRQAVEDALDHLPPQTAATLCSNRSSLTSLSRSQLLVLFQDALSHSTALDLLANMPSRAREGQLLIDLGNRSLATFAKNSGKVSVTT